MCRPKLLHPVTADMRREISVAALRKLAHLSGRCGFRSSASRPRASISAISAAGE